MPSRSGSSSQGLRRLGAALALAALLAAPAARATSAPPEIAVPPLAESAVPEPLRAWVAWALAGHERARCPLLAQPGEERVCAWPSRLALDVDARSGRFVLEWRVFAEGFVPLPGDERVWPRDVRIGERAAVVLLREGRPAIRLDAGAHRVSGRFEWTERPASLVIPAEVGLVTLRRDGASVDAPAREADGRLWLGERGASEEAGIRGRSASDDRLVLDVRRRLHDVVPAELETRVDLDVAGRAREQRLTGIALPGFEPLALDSPLPARVDANGDLVLQLRPGRFALVLHARSTRAPGELTLPPLHEGTEPDAMPGARDETELWAFEADPSLRVVDLQGGTPLDPEQTTLPPEWRAFPAFALQPGDTLRVVEKRRGDADPPPDRLSIARMLWLDFDGAGLTVRDRLKAEMQRGWRLEVDPALALGRVTVEGRDLPVTTLPGSALRGVEIRSGAVRVEADARVEGTAGVLPAAGWRHDVVSLQSELRLPPGWRLLHASGPDEATPTFTGGFTNLDLFLIPIFAMAAARLFGAPLGALALATLFLCWHEIGAPRWIWAALLALEALVRLVTAPRWSRALRLARLATLAGLCVIAAAFAIAHVRAALHPALEMPSSAAPVAAVEDDALARENRLERAAEGLEMRAEEMPAAAVPAEQDVVASGEPDVVARRLMRPKSPGVGEPYRPALGGSARDPYAIDPATPITTGPGVPDWQWRRVALLWRGPVTADQSLRLWLLSPRMSAIVSFLRVALLAALVLAWLRAVRRERDGRPGAAAGVARGTGASHAAASSALALLCALGPLVLPRSARAGDLPSPELLAELRARLLAEPECLPDCVTLAALRIEARPERVRLRFALDAGAMVALPLLAAPAALAIDAATLDGESSLALRRDGTMLQSTLPPGRHELVLEGRALGDAIELAPGLLPRVVESSLEGWRLEGDAVEASAGSALRLVRSAGTTPSPVPAPPGAGSALPPLFRVVRSLSFSATWEVATRIERVSPPGVAASFSVPLLPGESPSTEAVRVEQGAVHVVLGPQDGEIAWRSALPQGERLVLEAAADRPFFETWEVESSALWHVESAGLAPVHLATRDASPRARAWRPWPGERVELAITRPSGIEGGTLTLDRVALSSSPGARATDATLGIVLRSSRGGSHVVSLPADAELQGVSIDGREQPLRVEAGRLALPLVPGTQRVELRWREPHGVARHWRSTELELGAPGVNASLRVEMPRDRWTLFVGGPLLGPAVLFWSVLAVLVPIALALARTGLAPLGATSWLLLGLGLTQVPVLAAALVPAWLLALGARRRRGAALGDAAFRSAQIALLGLTLAALLVLFAAVRQGLLGLPEMQIAGNGSSSAELHWYQDRFEGALPRASVVSLPLWVYRAAMLVWSFWLAAALLRWGRFAVDALTEGGFWRALPRPRRPQEMRPPAAPPAAPGA